MTIPKSAVQLAATMAGFLLLTTLATGLRMWLVRQSKRSFLAADYMVVLALVFYYSNAIVVYLLLAIGHLGYPSNNEDSESWRVVFLFKCFYYIQISFAVGMGLIKCSIIFLLRSIFAATCPNFSKISRVVFGFCLCWSAMTIIIAFVNCRPQDQHLEFIAVGAVDVATDLMIIVLPMPLVWPRRLPTAKKMSLIAVFALGIFTIAAAVCRMVIVLKTDFTVFFATGSPVILWSMIEWGIAILVANAPMLRPVVERIFTGHQHPQSALTHVNTSLETAAGSATLLRYIRMEGSEHR